MDGSGIFIVALGSLVFFLGPAVVKMSSDAQAQIAREPAWEAGLKVQVGMARVFGAVVVVVGLLTVFG